MTDDPRSLLRGSWRIVERLDGGEDTREPHDEDKFLWFLDSVIVTGDKWAAWEMPYTCTGKPDEGILQITRQDHWEPWIATAIFAILGKELRLCMGSKPDDRPSRFDSTAENGYAYYRAERCGEPVPK